MSNALILMAHGSSDPNWRAPFERLAEQLSERLATPLRLAYMEICAPSLEDTVAELAAEGVERAEILPLFFAAGRHLRKDVPGRGPRPTRRSASRCCRRWASTRPSSRPWRRSSPSVPANRSDPRVVHRPPFVQNWWLKETPTSPIPPPRQRRA